ncbi:MAG: ABC transporter permease [Bacteroidota bacterium]
MNSLGTMVDFKIVGVLKDFPINSHFSRQIFLSYENLKDYNAWYASDQSWGSFNRGMQCFVKLKPNVNKEQVDAAMPGLIKKYYTDEDVSTYSF